MALWNYHEFLVDEPRVEAFRRAIEATVSPGQVVLDLGTGLGTYGMFAARAGARVLAVESDPVIELARELAAENDLLDRMTFLSGWSRALAPPDRADVLVFEDFAPYLYEPTTAELMADLSARWLKPNATAIPRRIEVRLAPVTCAETFDALTRWRRMKPYELRLSALSHRLLNDLHHLSLSADALLGEGRVIGQVEPPAVPQPTLDASVDWEVRVDGEMHGLALWLDFDMAEGIVFSNAPGAGWTGWSQVFLPISEPVPVRTGDVVSACIATLGGHSGAPMWWRWIVRTGASEQEMNTFRGAPLSLERLRQAAPTSCPRLTTAGRTRAAALELMDGRHTVSEIVASLQERFPATSDLEGMVQRLVARAIASGEATSLRNGAGPEAVDRGIGRGGTLRTAAGDRL